MTDRKPRFLERPGCGRPGAALHPETRDDWVAGLRQGVLLALAVLALLMPRDPGGDAPQAGRLHTGALPAPAPAAAAPRGGELDMRSHTASSDVRRVAQWVLDRGDHGQRHFAILDKKDARVFVFEPSGRLLDATPVLLGYARGDDSVEGIGERPISQVRPEERTTPAGRFAARPGTNTDREEVLWVDYAAAVSMHRVRPNNPAERRLERLASPLASERRISYGCINVPVDFFDRVVWPTLGRGGGMVYVLPEHKALSEVFPQLARGLPLLAGEVRT